jgi:broad specificity phosphatase PhoE
MRTLEIRRHSMRNIPDQHLSPAGVELARRVGSSLGQFDRVVTSKLPRAFETAIAMGCTVDEQLEGLNASSEAVEAEINWDAGFAEWARVFKKGGRAFYFGQSQAALWRSIVDSLPENGRALIITHGGFIEAGTVALFLEDIVGELGIFCSYCEGVRVTFDGEAAIKVEILRVR